MKNIEAQGRIGALIVWINSADAMRPIGSIRKKLVSRLRLISDALDHNPTSDSMALAAARDVLEDIAAHPGPNADENAGWRVEAAREWLTAHPARPPKAESPDEVGEQVRAEGEPHPPILNR